MQRFCRGFYCLLLIRYQFSLVIILHYWGSLVKTIFPFPTLLSGRESLSPANTLREDSWRGMSAYIIWNSPIRKTCLLFLISMYSFLYYLFILCVFVDIYFPLWFINQFYIIDFVDQIVPALSTRNSFWLAPVSLWHVPILLFLNICLFSSATICSRLILCSPYPSPRISHFSVYSWFHCSIY